MKTTIKLIRRARRGDDEAIDSLLRMIRDEHMAQRLHRYRGRNVLIDDDSLESEFLLGVFVAIEKVDPDKGNPLLYLLWRGQMKVTSYCRQAVRRGIRLTCSCGYSGLPGYRGGSVRCPSCGDKTARTQMVIISSDENTGELPNMFSEQMDLDEVELEKDLAFDKATHAIAIEEMRSRLEGRRLELFDLLVLEEINGQTSRNYLKEIAGLWGVSPQRVNQYLRDVRAEIIRYYEGA